MNVATPPKPASVESAVPRLTELARFAGCAAKISQADLHKALAGLPVAADPRVLVGHDTSDDAAIIRLRDELALVETVDIFPPIVDDPYDYGRIAAANALSDIYAMGATPLNALSFVAWPVDTLGTEPLRQVLEGAAAICKEAGIAIAGGHSIVDEEPKFGLFVTGTIDPAPDRLQAGARPGDALVLTKPIGTGVLTTAVKRNAAPESCSPGDQVDDDAEPRRRRGDECGRRHGGDRHHGLRPAGPSRQHAARGLGRPARRSARGFPTAPCPCSTGHGLPEGWLCPGGTKRNLDYAAPNARFADSLSEPQRLLLADAQTSGGLLIAVPQAKLAGLVADLKKRGTLAAAVIGSVTAADKPGVIEVTA